MSFSFCGLQESAILGCIEEAYVQLKEIEKLEGGQQTDLRDYIDAAEDEILRRRGFHLQPTIC